MASSGGTLGPPTGLGLLGLRGRDLGAANKGSGLVDDQTRRFDVAVHRAARSQFTTFPGGDVAFDRAVHDNGFGSDLAFNLGVLADGKPSVGIDLAFDCAINVQLFLKLDRAFDGDSARKIPPDRGSSARRLKVVPVGPGAGGGVGAIGVTGSTFRLPENICMS